MDMEEHLLSQEIRCWPFAFVWFLLLIFTSQMLQLVLQFDSACIVNREHHVLAKLKVCIHMSHSTFEDTKWILVSIFFIEFSAEAKVLMFRVRMIKSRSDRKLWKDVVKGDERTPYTSPYRELCLRVRDTRLRTALPSLDFRTRRPRNRACTRTMASIVRNVEAACLRTRRPRTNAWSLSNPFKAWKTQQAQCEHNILSMTAELVSWKTITFVNLTSSWEMIINEPWCALRKLIQCI